MTFPVQRRWRPEEDAILTQHYGQVPRDELARLLPGRTSAAANQRASILHVRRLKEPRWTPADVEVLRSLFHAETLPAIAARLGRSEVGVKIKARRLGLRRRRRPALTLRQVARLMGVDWQMPRRWIRLGWLPAHPAPTPTRRILHVWREDLVGFLRVHPEAWDARKCQRLHLALGLVVRREDGTAGSRPAWLERKLSNDFRRRRRGSKRWTYAEDVELASLMRRGLTYQEIGERLGRTGVAVDHRVCNLGRRVWRMGKGA